VVGKQIVVVGGGDRQDFNSLRPVQTSEIYDPAANAWTDFKPLLDPGRGGMTSAAAPGNRVLAIGGVFWTDQGFVMVKEVDRSPNVHHNN